MNTREYEFKVFDNNRQIADFVRSVISADTGSDSFNIALSGGNTPKAIYTLLSEFKNPQIPWEKMKFFWGDERCVPPDNKESNYLMAKVNLFDRTDITDNQVFRIRGENDPEVEKERYRQTILSNTNGIFDLMFLGLGMDGHTASIFPDRMDLLKTEEVCDIAIHPDSGQVRITITGPVINASRKILFLVTGSEKSQVVYNIFHQKGAWDKYPASFIDPLDGEIIWILDRKAASRI